jgi:hypothetical protein
MSAADGTVRDRSAAGARLSRAHGLFNIVTGLWPVVHMRSFEAVSGPKVDRWLVRSVGGLMAANGLVQLRARDAEQRLSAQLGLGTSAVLAAVDVRYGTTGRISRIYLLDAAVQLAWVAAWTTTLRRGVEPADAAVTGSFRAVTDAVSAGSCSATDAGPA